MELQSVELYGADGDLPPQERKDVEAGRKARYLGQRFPGLVFHFQAVDDDPVEQPYVDTPYAYLCLQPALERFFGENSHAVLKIRYIQHDDNPQIQSDYRIEDCDYYFFQPYYDAFSPVVIRTKLGFLSRLSGRLRLLLASFLL